MNDEFVFNVALGRIRYYASLPGVNDALIAVLIKTAGLQADAVLADHDSLTALLAATNDEADFTNYLRLLLTSVAISEVDADDEVNIDADNLLWSNAGGATNNSLGKLVVCYDPDTTVADDSVVIPLTGHQFIITTDGNDLTGTVDPLGFMAATQQNPL